MNISIYQLTQDPAANSATLPFTQEPSHPDKYPVTHPFIQESMHACIYSLTHPLME